MLRLPEVAWMGITPSTLFFMVLDFLRISPTSSQIKLIRKTLVKQIHYQLINLHNKGLIFLNPIFVSKLSFLSQHKNKSKVRMLDPVQKDDPSFFITAISYEILIKDNFDVALAHKPVTNAIIKLERLIMTHYSQLLSKNNLNAQYDVNEQNAPLIIPAPQYLHSAQQETQYFGLSIYLFIFISFLDNYKELI